MGLCIAAHMAAPGSTVTLDSQAVVNHGAEEPYWEALDMDVRHIVATVIQSKNIWVRWSPGHRDVSSARDAQELDDIRQNNEVVASPSWPHPFHSPSTVQHAHPASRS